MALDKSALIDLLEALKITDVSDRVRGAIETLYQALIDAELTAVIDEPVSVSVQVPDGLVLSGHSGPAGQLLTRRSNDTSGRAQTCT